MLLLLRGRGAAELPLSLKHKTVKRRGKEGKKGCEIISELCLHSHCAACILLIWKDWAVTTIDTYVVLGPWHTAFALLVVVSFLMW